MLGEAACEVEAASDNMNEVILGNTYSKAPFTERLLHKSSHSKRRITISNDLECRNEFVQFFFLGFGQNDTRSGEILKCTRLFAGTRKRDNMTAW